MSATQQALLHAGTTTHSVVNGHDDRSQQAVEHRSALDCLPY
jgi:hypothetical protein